MSGSSWYNSQNIKQLRAEGKSLHQAKNLLIKAELQEALTENPRNLVPILDNIIRNMDFHDIYHLDRLRQRPMGLRKCE
jgi:hypothetical protein